jgi:hypothetical protein
VIIEFNWYCTLGWQEATNLLEGSLGSKGPGVSLLERKETHSITSDAY